jgi:hypothetical protein
MGCVEGGTLQAPQLDRAKLRLRSAPQLDPFQLA